MRCAKHANNKKAVRCELPFLFNKTKSRPWVIGLLFIALNLAKVVELDGKLALLVCSSILVNDTTYCSLVNLLNSSLVRFGSSCLVTSLESSIVLLYDGTELSLENLVLQGLRFDDLNALLRGLNVRHEVHLLQKY